MAATGGLLAAGAIGLMLVVFAGATLSPDPLALARVDLPLGAGSIETVSAVSRPGNAAARTVPTQVRGTRVWPRGLLAANHLVTIDVVIRRPGWIAWLAGGTERLRQSLVTPSASVSQQYLTVASGGPLRVRFRQPVAAVWYGVQGRLNRRVLRSPRSEVTLPRSGDAGSLLVAGVPRRWETAAPQIVSWFPAGGSAAAVATPAPGAQLGPDAPITMTFSKPVAQALGSAMPPVSPITPGTWHQVSSHTIVFRPQRYGYGLGATVTVALPRSIQLVEGRRTPAANVGSWSVASGSTLRLQQLLATLGYLPLRFSYRGTGAPGTPQAQLAAATNPPAGKFTWRYPNVPSALRGFWQPGTFGVMTRGALMAFENDHGLSPDGVAGPAVWRKLMDAAVSGRPSAFGYTFVSVNEGSQSLTLWHNGRTVITTPVNTGIASAPTATGTYPVFDHVASGTMSGTNPDGSHYDDPGVPWISYFNGGDALHGFDRASYGSPQSLGCVEMPVDTAGKIWPYTPIGTLVHVT